MVDIIESALLSKSETATTEFKEHFDISSSQEWCEIIKDIIAIANTSGGFIIFGVDESGTPVNHDTSLSLAIDPADVTNKIYKYTGYQFSEFKIATCIKEGCKLLVIIIDKVSIPIVFIKPGTYDIGNSKQKTAFGIGTVYFRHGAKSEPGNTDDLRQFFENKMERVREEWLKNVRQVIEAPFGTTIVSIPPNSDISAVQIETARSVRIVDDPNAIPINFKEEDIYKIAPYDYRSLTAALRDRYTNFVENSKYHNLRKSLESDAEYCRVRSLDPKNPKSSIKRFYSTKIIEEFDKYYVRR